MARTGIDRLSSRKAPRAAHLAPIFPLLDLLPAAVYTCDPDGLITWFNTLAVRVWGRKPRLRHPSDRWCGSFRLFDTEGAPVRHDQCWMALALRNQQHYDGREIVIERKDGERRTVLAHARPLHDASGSLLGAVNILVDVTDRRRTEQDLERTRNELSLRLDDLTKLHAVTARLSHEKDLRSILEETLATVLELEQTSMGLLSIWDEEAAVLEAGASSGFEPGVLRLLERVPSGQGAYGACFLQQARVVVEDVESDPRYTDCLDAARVAEFRAVHSTPLITRAGKAIGVLSTHHPQPHRPTEREVHLIDLYAQHAADCIENARLYALLKEADGRKDEFLAVLAHELRNPLAPMRTAMELMRHACQAGCSSARALDIMGRQLNQLVRLTDDLLDLSRITRGRIELRREKVGLLEVLQAAVETSRPVIEQAGHDLLLTHTGGAMWVEADPVRLAQVFSNLLNNAARYTDPGGRIDVRVERAWDRALVRVRDNGIGIAPEALPRIFEMFTQIDSTRAQAQGGLGIGLNIVRRLVEMHGGTVMARSEGPGMGCEFIVDLPVDVAASSRSGPEHGNRQSGASLTGLRLLVADDNLDAVQSLAELLRFMGAEVTTACDGQEAIQRIREISPDAALVDLGMPRLDGLEVARRLRAGGGAPGTVLIALTGWGQDEDRRRTREAGFDHHLVKPVDIPALTELLLGLTSSPPKDLHAARAV